MPDSINDSSRHRPRAKQLAVGRSFQLLHQQFPHAAFVRDLRGEFQSGESSRIRPPPAPRRADASASRPSSRPRPRRAAPEIRGGNPPAASCRSRASGRATFSPARNPAARVATRILPTMPPRMSSIVTRPAAPPNSSSTIARPRCCFCNARKSWSRFMDSGTNDGNSITSARSIFGSSSKARVFRMPTMVSGVSS